MRALGLLFILLASPTLADTLVAARTIRAQAILSPTDVALVAGTVPGALDRVEDAVGLEARVVLYAGRPIRAGDVGPPAVIDRNQIVRLRYSQGTLNIAAEGRALDRAGIGDRIRVMNLDSRSTVVGRVAEDGSVVIAGNFP